MRKKNNQEDILVSVIIPIHNAGEWLERCLDTLMNQTLSAVEFICVLDCPTDGSDITVESYAEFDKRFVILKNEVNAGVSASRNKGLLAARGEYIGFSDHDDWREPDMYEKLYKQAKKEEADIVFSNSFVEEGCNSTLVVYKNPTWEGVVKSIFLPMFSHHSENFLAKSVWASIYKRTAVLNSRAAFGDRKKYWEEDSLFNFTMFSYTTKIAYCKLPFYHWNLNRTALTANYEKVTSIEVLLNTFRTMSAMLNNLSINKKEILKKRFLSVAFYHYYYHYRNYSITQLQHLIRQEEYPYLSIFYSEANVFSNFNVRQVIGRVLKLIKFYLFIRRIKQHD
ncbi:MAG: glycosyltransferase family 2 protein [Prevotellaceae bacterium]|jgi:glycosyltransferase involved in cell wall biosynthesis|nr:glycosyltransferase family 2 protein [Prevotellaceae bacterium]